MRHAIIYAPRLGDGVVWPERSDQFDTKPPSYTITGEDIVHRPAELGGHGAPLAEKHFRGPASLIVTQASDAVRAAFETGKRGAVGGDCRNCRRRRPARTFCRRRGLRYFRPQLRDNL